MEALDRAIAQLPHDLRAALVLSVLEQHSHAECAELLGTTPKTVETRIYRARKLLLDLMSRAGF
jgi:RNA polymerase sigma-70 factor (ECF subfamily)